MSKVTDGPSAALRTMRAELEQLKSRLSQRDSEVSFKALVGIGYVYLCLVVYLNICIESDIFI